MGLPAVKPDEPEPLTDEQRQAFLDYIRDYPDASTLDACHALAKTHKIRRYQIRHAKAHDPEFARDYRSARGYGNQHIRNQLRMLAIDGVAKPLVSNGKVVKDDNGQIIEVTEYSERLLEFLARMYLPEAREMQARRLGVEITGAGGGPVQVQQGVSLADVAAVLAAAGALDGTGTDRPALPAGTPEVIDAA